MLRSVAYLGGGACASPPPFGRTAVIFVTILGLFLAPFRDKIAATAYSAPNLFTVDSRRVVPAR